MSKRLGTKQAKAMKNAGARGDATLEEFEVADLGESVSATAAVVRPQVMTSIRLDTRLVEKLKKRASGLGIGYQTLLKMIVTKHADDEL